MPSVQATSKASRPRRQTRCEPGGGDGGHRNSLLGQSFWLPDPTEGYVMVEVSHDSVTLEVYKLSDQVERLRAEETGTVLVRAGSDSIELPVPVVRGLERCLDEEPVINDLGDIHASAAAGSILHQLRRRFELGTTYTSVRDVFISINPYTHAHTLNTQHTDVHSLEFVWYFRSLGQQALDRLPPHIYATAATAYERMKRTQTDQAILLLGEAASGKTGCLAHLAHYFGASASMCTARDTRTAAGPADTHTPAPTLPTHLLERALSIARAFSTAGTTTHTRRSSAGMLLDLSFSPHQAQLIGAQIEHYFTDRSVLAHRDVKRGERSFDILYCLVRGLTPEQRSATSINADADRYRYLTCPYRADGNSADTLTSDGDRLQEMLTWFREDFQMPEDIVQSLIRVLSAVLLLGELKFGLGEHEEVTIAWDLASHLSALLGISFESLRQALCSAPRTSRTTDALDQASVRCDDLATFLYHRVWDHVVRCVLNPALRARESDSTWQQPQQPQPQPQPQQQQQQPPQQPQPQQQQQDYEEGPLQTPAHPPAEAEQSIVEQCADDRAQSGAGGSGRPTTVLLPLQATHAHAHAYTHAHANAHARSTHVLVVDIPGMDTLHLHTHACASVRDMLRAYVAETLQDVFVDVNFRLERHLCVLEQAPVQPFEVPEGLHALDLMEGLREPGLLACIDAETLPGERSQMEALASRVYREFKGHAALLPVPPPRSAHPLKRPQHRDTSTLLTIRHYAADVTYDTRTFAALNRPLAIPSDFEQALAKSTNPLVARLFAAGGDDDASHSPACLHPDKTATANSQDDVTVLLQRLRFADAHFVYCLRSNDTFTPNSFDGSTVLRQLRSSSLLSMATTRKCLYASSMTHLEFLLRYDMAFVREYHSRRHSAHVCERHTHIGVIDTQTDTHACVGRGGLCVGGGTSGEGAGCSGQTPSYTHPHTHMHTFVCAHAHRVTASRGSTLFSVSRQSSLEDSLSHTGVCVYAHTRSVGDCTHARAGGGVWGPGRNVASDRTRACQDDKRMGGKGGEGVRVSMEEGCADVVNAYRCAFSATGNMTAVGGLFDTQRRASRVAVTKEQQVGIRRRCEALVEAFQRHMHHGPQQPLEGAGRVARELAKERRANERLKRRCHRFLQAFEAAFPRMLGEDGVVVGTSRVLFKTTRDKTVLEVFRQQCLANAMTKLQACFRGRKERRRIASIRDDLVRQRDLRVAKQTAEMALRIALERKGRALKIVEMAYRLLQRNLVQKAVACAEKREARKLKALSAAATRIQSTYRRARHTRVYTLEKAVCVLRKQTPRKRDRGAMKALLHSVRRMASSTLPDMQARLDTIAAEIYSLMEESACACALHWANHTRDVGTLVCELRHVDACVREGVCGALQEEDKVRHTLKRLLARDHALECLHRVTREARTVAEVVAATDVISILVQHVLNNDLSKGPDVKAAEARLESPQVCKLLRVRDAVRIGVETAAASTMREALREREVIMLQDAVGPFAVDEAQAAHKMLRMLAMEDELYDLPPQDREGGPRLPAHVYAFLDECRRESEARSHAKATRPGQEEEGEDERDVVECTDAQVKNLENKRAVVAEGDATTTEQALRALVPDVGERERYERVYSWVRNFAVWRQHYSPPRPHAWRLPIDEEAPAALQPSSWPILNPWLEETKTDRLDAIPRTSCRHWKLFVLHEQQRLAKKDAVALRVAAHQETGGETDDTGQRRGGVYQYRHADSFGSTTSVYGGGSGGQHNGMGGGEIMAGGGGDGDDNLATTGAYAGSNNWTVKALQYPQGPLSINPHPHATCTDRRRPAVHAQRLDEGGDKAAVAGGGDTGVYAGTDNWTVKALSQYSSSDDNHSPGRSLRTGLLPPRGPCSDTEIGCGVAHEGGAMDMSPCGTPRGALGTIPESASVCSDTSSSSFEEEEEDRGSFMRPSALDRVEGLSGSMNRPTDPTLHLVGWPDDQDTLRASVDRLFCEALSSLNMQKRVHLASKKERKRLALIVRPPFIPPGCA